MYAEQPSDMAQKMIYVEGGRMVWRGQKGRKTICLECNRSIVAGFQRAKIATDEEFVLHGGPDERFNIFAPMRK
jgi:hypothetical protein